jgi:hypothetical protein
LYTFTTFNSCYMFCPCYPPQCDQEWWYFIAVLHAIQMRPQLQLHIFHISAAAPSFRTPCYCHYDFRSLYSQYVGITDDRIARNKKVGWSQFILNIMKLSVGLKVSGGQTDKMIKN